MHTRHSFRQLNVLVIGLLTCAACAMGQWSELMAQSEQCSGVDMTCLQEDRDTHGGHCFNFSFKQITLSGRDPQNMRTGWYAYSHRGGGFMPLDPTVAPVWQGIIEDLELLRELEHPEDEVNACLLYDFSGCLSQLRDSTMCVAAQQMIVAQDDCQLTLRKMSLPGGSALRWYGFLAGSEGAVPVAVPSPSTSQQFQVAAYSRYGGSLQVLRWLELADAIGTNSVNVCELRAAHQCFTDGEFEGDVSACAELFITAH